MLRKIPKAFLILMVAVIASVIAVKGGSSGAVFATAGIIAMPKPKRTKKVLVVKAKRMAKRKPEELLDIDLDFISVLTDGNQPANGAPVIVKSVEGGVDKYEVQMHVIKKDDKKGILYATVYEPDKVDAQNQFASAEQIEKMAHNLLRKGRAGIDVNHNLIKSQSSLVESFILRGTDPMFEGISKGSYCVAIQLSEDLKDLDISGVSMYGHAAVKKEDPGEPAEPDNDIGPAMQAIRVTAGIGDVQMSSALGVEHGDYLKWESGDPGIVVKFSGEQLAAAAKLLKMPVQDLAAQIISGSAEEDAPEATPDPTVDPAEPAPAGPAKKSVSNPSIKMPTARRVLKATIPSVIKVSGNGQNVIEVKKSIADQHRLVGKAALLASKAILIAKGYMTEDQFESQEQLISKGLFAAGDFDPSGSLQPALAREVFDVTVDRSGFLKRIQTVMMTSIMQNVAVADIGERTMTRITVAGSPGATVSSGTQAKTVNLAKQLHAYVVDLPFFIGFDLVFNYQGNLPALEQKIGEIIMLSYGNQHVDLGFNGTTNTYASSFVSLSEGWFALAIRVIAAATDGANTAQNISISGDVTLTTPAKILDKMISVMTQYQARYANNPNNVFIMSPSDFQTFETGLIARPNADTTLVDGARYKYRGHEIIVVDYLSTGNYMYTPLQNFIYAMVTQGQGGTRLQSLEVLGGIQHNLSSAVDFDFVNYQPLVIAQP